MRPPREPGLQDSHNEQAFGKLPSCQAITICVGDLHPTTLTNAGESASHQRRLAWAVGRSEAAAAPVLVDDYAVHECQGRSLVISML